ncbi:MAG TPA: hypothetical protein VMA74_21445 [Dyella sp.]|uniref:hypothetical protein n=1 Tax=Dyella sp. TaxID=1869338 RepID=UPI002CC3B3D9|nr:hypothetical protein [Dyella sp.]HUB92303.1 hypothetical protein [Dyella sp.]
MSRKLAGWPDAITAYDWIAAKATHKLDGNGGYLMSLELESKATATDHAAVNEDDDYADDERLSTRASTQ